MNENIRNDSSGIRRVLGHLAAEKKKTGIAVCLIAVMAVMWGKVLLKKGPESAAARPSMEETELERQLDEAMKITYVDLPQVPGRDDVISRDFFASGGWQDFTSDDPEDRTVDKQGDEVVAVDDSERVIGIVKQLLRLQVIGMGPSPQAFLNDKLMSVGHKLIVTDGSEMYECEVVEISEKSVLVRCREIDIELKLVETADGDG